VLAGPTVDALAVIDAAEGSSSWTKGVVKKAGNVGPVTVLGDNFEIVANPVDFPHDWEFLVGDWVGVHLERGLVCPFLSGVEAVGDHIEHVVPNDVPARSRRVRRMQITTADRPN
jgi:hypothetical protein